MAIHQYANNPQTTLAGALTAGSTSLTVSSATGFPARGKFTVIIDSEIILVTGVAGTTWTVERGREGTTAAAHNNNATVTQILTVDSFLNANHFDVRFFGATGDGVTDDTAAVQAACDAAIPVGGEVFFPIGTYIIDTITTTGDESQPLSIRGAGFGSVLKLKGGTTADSMFKFFGTVSSLTVRDLKVDGNSANVSGDGRAAFRVHGSDVTFNNVLFVDVIQEAIYHTAGSSPQRDRVIVTDCIFRNAGRYAIATEFASLLVVANNVAEDCGAGFISCESSSYGTDEIYDVTISGNTIRNTGNAIANDNAGVIGLWGVPDQGASIASAVRRIAVTGNVIDGAGASGIAMGNVANVTVVGNVVYGCGAWGILNSDAGGTKGSAGLVISGNNIRDCGVTAPNTYASIYLDRTTDSIITGNVSMDFSPRLKYHLEITADCNNNLVGMNNYRGTALTAQQIIGGASNTTFASHRQ